MTKTIKLNGYTRTITVPDTPKSAVSSDAAARMAHARSFRGKAKAKPVVNPAVKTANADAWKAYPISAARIEALTSLQSSLKGKNKRSVEQIKAMTKGEAQDYFRSVRPAA